MHFPQRIDSQHRAAKLHRLAYGGIQNPVWRENRNTFITLKADNLAVTTIERTVNLHLGAKIGVPSIVDPVRLLDMGGMNGNWP